MDPRSRTAGEAQTRWPQAMRLAGLMHKEFLQILRDPSSIAIAFLMPVVLLVIFGYGVSLDAKGIPIALVIEQPGAEASAFAGALGNSEYFVTTTVRTMEEARQAMVEGRADAIVHLRSDFARQLRRPGGAPIQVLLNGVDANRARVVSGYIAGAWQTWLISQAAASGVAVTVPVAVEERVWFNSELRSRDFLVPGLVAIITTLIGSLLTAMVVAREWERGTMEALLVTPVHIREILLGKLVPYFALGMGGMAVTVGVGVLLLGVPLRGSLLVLAAVAAVFLLVALGVGLLISVATKNQFVAGQIAILTSFLPAFMLSGFIFNIASAPLPIQWLTRIVAARYFVSILHTVFMAGDIWAVILPNLLVLAAMGTIFLTLARLKSRKHLE
ncbi:MAG: ABC transporter permease [Planctomycetaceae bacterium]|nr:ABC transporter permease [Planctomycetaceae bacterium]